MGGCAAINCSNSGKNYRMFAFPTDPVRRMKWVINCRRKSWFPSPRAQLCSVHFEESQFEQNRQDGWKKLKQTAIPTLFNIPKNQPDAFFPKRMKEHPKPGTVLEPCVLNMENMPENSLRKRIVELQKKNVRLKEKLADNEKSMKYLTKNRKNINKLDRKSITNWSQEEIIQRRKLRYCKESFLHIFS